MKWKIEVAFCRATDQFLVDVVRRITNEMVAEMYSVEMLSIEYQNVCFLSVIIYSGQLTHSSPSTSSVLSLIGLLAKQICQSKGYSRFPFFRLARTRSFWNVGNKMEKSNHIPSCNRQILGGGGKKNNEQNSRRDVFSRVTLHRVPRPLFSQHYYLQQPPNAFFSGNKFTNPKNTRGLRSFGS